MVRFFTYQPITHQICIHGNRPENVVSERLKRRLFLQRSVTGVSAASLFGCADDGPWQPLSGDTDPSRADVESTRGTFAGMIPLIDARKSQFGVIWPGTGDAATAGLDGSRALDLSDADTHPQTPNDRFFIRTLTPPVLSTMSADPAHWQIESVKYGQRRASQSLTALFDGLPTITRDVLLECAGNHRFTGFGMMSAARFSGVTFESVLRAGKLGFADNLPTLIATATIKISGIDYPAPTQRSDGRGNRMSYIFRIKDLIDDGALLVNKMNGQPLPLNHGSPLRLVVPHWYGCTCIKWLNGFALVNSDERATPQMEEFAGRTGQSQHIVAAMKRQRATDHRYSSQHDRDVAYRDYDKRTETFTADQYRPALIQRAATPIRVERYVNGRQVWLRIIGVAWGRPLDGDARPLQLRFQNGRTGRTTELRPVRSSEASATDNATWSFWSFHWTPPAAYADSIWAIQPRLTDHKPSRLNSTYYDRYFQFDTNG